MVGGWRIFQFGQRELELDEGFELWSPYDILYEKNEKTNWERDKKSKIKNEPFQIEEDLGGGLSTKS